MMGRKMGFYATDEDQVQMRKSMDSMMQQRAPTQSDVEELLSKTEPSTDIVYLDGIKKIAGYECKKAMIIATRSNGKTDTTNVWYVPDLKLKGVSNTGGSLGGFGSMSPQLSADDMINLNGFPMQYERKLNRGRKMIVEVTKLVTDKEVTDKEFNIPKDVEVKPMKEMQNGGGFRMRIGG